MGIPACLWRRTGEIYKGNKEFAELVGVPIESLRDGKLAIYELMEEGPPLPELSSIDIDSFIQRVRQIIGKSMGRSLSIPDKRLF